MATATAYGRLARRRSKLLALAERYDSEEPEVAVRYRAMARDLESRLRGASVCLKCGKPLKPGNAFDGYGPECFKKVTASNLEADKEIEGK